MPFSTTPNICLAEWLRRWTRNPLGHSRVGSNPAADETYFCPIFLERKFGNHALLLAFYLPRYCCTITHWYNDMNGTNIGVLSTSEVKSSGVEHISLWIPCMM